MSFLFTQEEVTEMRIRREKREQAEETAIKLLKRGRMTTEEIAEDTGLAIDKIKALKKSLLQKV